MHDESTTEPFDSTNLSTEVAQSFKKLWGERTFRTVALGPGTAPDAILHITILEKHAAFNRADDKRQVWNLCLAARMELIDKSGVRIWLREDPSITFAHWQDTSATPFSWKSSGALHEVSYNLAMRTGTLIYFPNALKSPTEHQ